MVRAHGKTGFSHLFAGLIALGLAGAVLFAAEKAVIHLEHATVLSNGFRGIFPQKPGTGLPTCRRACAKRVADLWQLRIIDPRRSGKGK